MIIIIKSSEKLNEEMAIKAEIILTINEADHTFEVLKNRYTTAGKVFSLNGIGEYCQRYI